MDADPYREFAATYRRLCDDDLIRARMRTMTDEEWTKVMIWAMDFESRAIRGR